MTQSIALPIPMFPLGTVLFPFAALPLHVFEPRYRALTEDCLKGNGEFGVVLIERGLEVGGGDTRFSIGTIARIVEAAKFPDGRYALLAVGSRRAKVQTWLPDDPYPLALVHDLPDDPPDGPDGAQLADAERSVRRALALKAELAEPAVPATVALDDDPERAGFQLAAYAPLGPVDHQRVLEAPSWSARLALLVEVVDDLADVFAFRLATG